MGMFDSLASIAGPVMTVAGVATANPALIAAGVGAGAWSASQAQAAANQTNMDIAQNQMNFQESMANTSYQRVVKDLQAAGLNPMLAYTQGGAAVPTGATTQVQSTVKPENMQSAVQGAQAILQAQNTAADVQLKNQQANTQAAQQEGIYAAAARDKATAAREMSQTYNPGQFGRLVDTQMDQNRTNAVLNANTAQNVKDQIAPGSDPWYVRAVKHLGNSAQEAWEKKIAPTNKYLYNGSNVSIKGQ